MREKNWIGDLNGVRVNKLVASFPSRKKIFCRNQRLISLWWEAFVEGGASQLPFPRQQHFLSAGSWRPPPGWLLRKPCLPPPLFHHLTSMNDLYGLGSIREGSSGPFFSQPCLTSARHPEYSLRRPDELGATVKKTWPALQNKASFTPERSNHASRIQPASFHQPQDLPCSFHLSTNVARKRERGLPKQLSSQQSVVASLTPA